MKKIVKIAALGLPMLALAPIVGLGTNKNTSVRVETMSDDDGIYVGKTLDIEIDDKEWVKKDKLMGVFHILVTRWNATEKLCAVTLDVVQDDGRDHDGEFQPVYGFEMTCMKNNEVDINSGNGKAWFAFSFNSDLTGYATHIHVEALSAYSWLQNEKSWDL